MKRVLGCLLLLSSLASGTITLRQSNAGGTVSSSGTGPNPATFNTSSVGFTSTTQAGSLLLCVVYGAAQQTGGQIMSTLNTNGVTTSGLTWNALWSDADYDYPDGVHRGTTNIYYVANAPSISPSTLTTAQFYVIPNATTTYNVQGEFELYEFTPVSSTWLIVHVANLGSASIPSAGNITTTTSDNLIVASYIGDSSSGGTNVTAGSGYTLGINASLATFGQMQWYPDATLGTFSTAFGGSIPGHWAEIAGSFKVLSPSSAVPRQRGSVF